MYKDISQSFLTVLLFHHSTFIVIQSLLIELFSFLKQKQLSPFDYSREKLHENCRITERNLLVNEHETEEEKEKKRKKDKQEILDRIYENWIAKVHIYIYIW